MRVEGTPPPWGTPFEPGCWDELPPQLGSGGPSPPWGHPSNLCVGGSCHCIQFPEDLHFLGGHPSNMCVGGAATKPRVWVSLPIQGRHPLNLGVVWSCNCTQGRGSAFMGTPLEPGCWGKLPQHPESTGPSHLQGGHLSNLDDEGSCHCIQHPGEPNFSRGDTPQSWVLGGVATAPRV